MIRILILLVAAAPAILCQSVFVPNVLPGGLQNSVVAINSASDKAAHIIQAVKTGTVAAVQWATGIVTTGCTLDIRLETVDPVTGYPTGTLASAGADGPQAVVVANRNTSLVTPLGTPVSVNQGDILAIVIANPPASPCSKQIRYVNVADISHVVFPYGATFTFGAWTKSTLLGPQAGLQYQDGSYAASPFTYLISYFATVNNDSNSKPNH